jgi:LysR family hydrogen peroxide-inducible transcriptional activator
MRRFERLAREDDGDVGGPFRLGVIPTASPYLVPLFLGPFLGRYPKVELTIEEMQTEALVAALERETLDAGLLATPVEGVGLDVRPLFDEPFYLFAPEGHPLAAKPFVRESDFGEGDLLLLSDGHCLRAQVLQLCALGRKQPRTKVSRALAATFESGNLETLARMVERGLGCTLLPYLAAMPHGAVGRAPRSRRDGVVVPFQEPIPAREISLVTSRLHATRRVCDALATTIQEALPRALRSAKADMRIIPIDAR